MREMRKTLITVLTIIFLVSSMSICVQAKSQIGAYGNTGENNDDEIGEKKSDKKCKNCHSNISTSPFDFCYFCMMVITGD